MEYVIEHTPSERRTRVRTMISTRIIRQRDVAKMLTLIDKLADLDCCCPTHHRLPTGTTYYTDPCCPGGDCDGCPDCLSGQARRIIVRLGGD